MDKQELKIFLLLHLIFQMLTIYFLKSYMEQPEIITPLDKELVLRILQIGIMSSKVDYFYSQVLI